MANALFVCLHNAGRSQMSEALFARAAEGRHGARSAGTEPAERVHPEVIEAMDEIGIDLRGRVPRRLLEPDAQWANVVVTMGCGDECPYIPGRRYVDWDLPDPKGRPLADVRAIRDEIERRVQALLEELDPIACSLEANDLQQRLAEIAEVGAESLIERGSDGERHLLRFRSDGETRRRLEAIVAAEAKCCSFLELSLEEGDGELILTIGSPRDGQPIADELAAAFAR